MKRFQKQRRDALHVLFSLFGNALNIIMMYTVNKKEKNCNPE